MSTEAASPMDLHREIHRLDAGHFAWEQAAEDYGRLVVDGSAAGIGVSPRAKPSAAAVGVAVRHDVLEESVAAARAQSGDARARGVANGDRQEPTEGQNCAVR
jgi:hypothetical protein